jgi:uncharacterized membrane protein YidH (DUF202 family)
MDEQEVLAVIRTLLAYERNYLAIERTQLAQLRTGLAIALIVPPAAATYAYAFEFLPKNSYVDIVIYVFLALITFYGIYMCIHSYLGLRQTRRIERKLQKRQAEIIKQSPSITALLDDILPKQQK